ncbi:MAG: glycerophosphodiester phosphodiesterase [Oscillospiraceae bacterium]|nr:glycerophosphodiester phosphodiesterase [Oscillospiraceae bacterium]
MARTKIQAHRGASAYLPENTMEAFALAAEQKADGIELDVHLTKDGYAVVAHDERLERVSDGTGLINAYTLEELRRLNFGKLFPDLPPCRIPTLAEVYTFVRETGMMVNVELKTTMFFYPGLAQKLVELAREYSMEDRVIYSSFNHYSLMEVKKLNPDAKIGLLYQLGMVDPWVYANYTKAYAIHPHYFIIASLPETVEMCHKNGVAVNVWTVNEPEVMKEMMKLGVDGIITDKPDLAFACHEEICVKGGPS